MQRDLVLRASTGDHDAFASLATDAYGRLHRTARLILRREDRRRTRSRRRSPRPGSTSGRSAIRTASTPGSTGSSSEPATRSCDGRSEVRSEIHVDGIEGPGVDDSSGAAGRSRPAGARLPAPVRRAPRGARRPPLPGAARRRGRDRPGGPDRHVQVPPQSRPPARCARPSRPTPAWPGSARSPSHDRPERPRPGAWRVVRRGGHRRAASGAAGSSDRDRPGTLRPRPALVAGIGSRWVGARRDERPFGAASPTFGRPSSSRSSRCSPSPSPAARCWSEVGWWLHRRCATRTWTSSSRRRTCRRRWRPDLATLLDGRVLS